MRRRKRVATPPVQAPPESPPADPAVQAAVAAVPGWFHSIDVGGGVVTPGHKSNETLDGELGLLGLPDLHDLSVLDVGAWDGYFSFACERLGARRVVALDHYAWSVDFPALHRYNQECRQAGRAPDPHETVPGVWRPDTLPRQQGFDTARRLLGSRVECTVAPPPDAAPVDYEWHYGRAIMHARKADRTP